MTGDSKTGGGPVPGPAEAHADKPLVVGVVSDTHGQLYPRVKALLQGVDHIVHAGDIGSPQVLQDLRAIAPVTAVRGNTDLESWARVLPLQAEVDLGGVRVVVRHISGALPASPETRVAINGHSHMAELEWRGGVLHLNPGSAGPQRFGRSRTVAKLVITPGGAGRGAARVDAEIVNAEDPAATA